MEPEWFGERHVPPDVDGEGSREVGRPVLPGGEWDVAGAGLDGAQAQAEWGGTRPSPGPTGPKSGRTDGLTLGFRRVADPHQFQVGVLEEEPAAGRALAGVGVGRALGQAERHEPIGLRAANVGPDEEVVEFGRGHAASPGSGHGRSSARGVARTRITARPPPDSAVGARTGARTARTPRTGAGSSRPPGRRGDTR